MRATMQKKPALGTGLLCAMGLAGCAVQRVVALGAGAQLAAVVCENKAQRQARVRYPSSPFIAQAFFHGVLIK